MLTFTTKNPTFFDYFDALDRVFSDSNVFGTFDSKANINSNATSEVFAQFRTDVEDHDTSYVLSAELPGFNKEEIKIDVKEDVLTITAAHKTETVSETPTESSSVSDTANIENSDSTAITASEEKPIANSVRIIRKERRSCNYKRSFNIDGIEAAGIKANYNNGILTVTLPKSTPTEPERIQIDVA